MYKLIMFVLSLSIGSWFYSSVVLPALDGLTRGLNEIFAVTNNLPM